jgi:uncharacterized protein (TIGR00369 family)
MHAPDPNYRDVVERGFREAAFLSHIGLELVDCGPGWCESTLRIKSHHLQHTGVVHAGLQTTMADHTAGGATMTVTPAQEYILTVEFKMHLLRGCSAESLWCRADVLKPGSRFHVVESQVYAVNRGEKTLVSKFIGTMAVLPRE